METDRRSKMRKYAETKKVLYTKASPNGWDTVQVRSKSNPDKTYTVDMTNGRCSCPAWIFQRGGDRAICKHLRMLGFKQIIQANEYAPDEKVGVPLQQKVKVKA